MHAKFQVAGFQNKRDIHHRSLDFVCYFYSNIYWSRLLGIFLSMTAAKFRLVGKISDQYIKT